MTQTQVKRDSQGRFVKKEAAPEVRVPASDEEIERLKAETDALLDEIDGILTEEHEFAATYIQKGGQ